MLKSNHFNRKLVCTYTKAKKNNKFTAKKYYLMLAGRKNFALPCLPCRADRARQKRKNALQGRAGPPCPVTVSDLHPPPGIPPQTVTDILECSRIV